MLILSVENYPNKNMDQILFMFYATDNFIYMPSNRKLVTKSESYFWIKGS